MESNAQAPQPSAPQGQAPSPAPAVLDTQPAPAPAPAPNDDQNETEWDDVTNDLYPGINKQQSTDDNEEDDPDEPKKPDEEPKTPEAPKEGENKQEPPKPDDAAANKEGEEPKGAETETPAEEHRPTASEFAQQLSTVKKEVMDKMFGGYPTELTDRDGDPIRTVDDVMNLINPNTKEPFTEKEAGEWLLSAQQQLTKTREDIEKQAEAIAEVQLTLKEESDYVKRTYGELLKDEKLRDDTWEQFSNTLVRDQESGLITKAPTSMRWFYDTVLGPKLTAKQSDDAAAQAQQAAADAAAAEAAKQAAEQAKKEAEENRQRKRQDRSDIYAPSQADEGNKDVDEDEWDDVRQDYYGKK